MSRLVPFRTRPNGWPHLVTYVHYCAYLTTFRHSHSDIQLADETPSKRIAFDQQDCIGNREPEKKIERAIKAREQAKDQNEADKKGKNRAARNRVASG